MNKQKVLVLVLSPFSWYHNVIFITTVFVLDSLPLAVSESERRLGGSPFHFITAVNLYCMYWLLSNKQCSLSLVCVDQLVSLVESSFYYYKATHSTAACQDFSPYCILAQVNGWPVFYNCSIAGFIHTNNLVSCLKALEQVNESDKDCTFL